MSIPRRPAREERVPPPYPPQAHEPRRESGRMAVHRHPGCAVCSARGDVVTRDTS